MTAYLADTSVLSRAARIPAIGTRVADLRRSGSLWTCDVVSLELGYSARNHAEWDTAQAAQALLHQAPIEAAVTRRALEVQGLLARRGHHRVALPDLVVAAAAERAGVAVLHYDRDYATIAEETGQDAEWVVPPGFEHAHGRRG
ncbi:MAG TPA: PIN domain-containing protein [Acidimicrobiales bacterium]|nr:PIN domain-containing protein [Acidimicrobiales bacterium]